MESISRNMWYKLLEDSDANRINVERVKSLDDPKNTVLNYVMQTLSYVDKFTTKSEFLRSCVETALQWSEVAKCGSREMRARWKESGYQLDIHNEASAEIYKDMTDDDIKTITIVYALIKTHGLIGQYLRGEVCFHENAPLCELIAKNLLTKEELKDMLCDLNMAIIAAVDPVLWEEKKDDVFKCINLICEGNIYLKQSALDRLKLIFPAYKTINTLTAEEETLFGRIFSCCDLWFPYAALSSFSRKEIVTIFTIISEHLTKRIKHITFFNFSKDMNYDYEGKRRENIYRKRIVELFLREYADGIEDKTKQHLSIDITVDNDTISFNVKFTKVCDALINFCVEAERSGFMDYQKNIITIFDLFGFRKDIFDRLNNEEKYLQTMNAADNSTKFKLLNYVVGNSITDVGSGGGILLDKVESMYPDKTITGTDVSSEVIERLQKKIVDEGHRYTVKLHNFVDGKLPTSQDTIIFSSILHEIYSYTKTANGKFDINAVQCALKNAADSLNDGGRILIRDGVKCNNNKMASVTFKTGNGVAFARNYVKDFKGLAEVDRGNVRLEGNTLYASADFIREALYTYTWGTESYSQEVQEQFGYFTIDEYLDFLRGIGLQIQYSEILTESGYPENLENLVTLNDVSWEELPSTCIIVASK